MTTAVTEAAYTAPPQLLFLSTRTHDQIQWTEERVLRRIYERQRTGRAMNYISVHREDLRLLSAARRLFGSWTEALEAAGINQPTTSRRPSVHTREAIIACLRKNAAAGLPITTHHPLLLGCWQAAQRRFGSWSAALEAAGVEPAAAGRRVAAYTRECVISRLREHAAAGQPIVIKHPRLSGYVKAARRLFGSWASALKAAGIPTPERAIKRVHTRESIITRLRAHAGAGQPVLTKHPGLGGCGSAALRLFGSWASALKAAGLPPSVRRRPRRTTRPERGSL